MEHLAAVGAGTALPHLAAPQSRQGPHLHRLLRIPQGDPGPVPAGVGVRRRLLSRSGPAPHHAHWVFVRRYAGALPLASEQLTRWFGLPLAATGVAAGILLPRLVTTTSAPARVDDDRSTHITADVFVTSSKERYPDLFGLTDGHHTGTPRARDEVLRILNRLPRQAIDLTHDQAASTRLLTTLTAALATVQPAEQ
ncbi:hypothetical protein [Streptomyces sp. NPDC049590]|uniref:hypothetical protein n=1 Tax=Streptomyces sp. NPDC049590 TaxID=3154834 RepID=UPI0034475CED